MRDEPCHLRVNCFHTDVIRSKVIFKHTQISHFRQLSNANTLHHVHSGETTSDLQANQPKVKKRRKKSKFSTQNGKGKPQQSSFISSTLYFGSLAFTHSVHTLFSAAELQYKVMLLQLFSLLVDLLNFAHLGFLGNFSKLICSIVDKHLIKF